jgi:hypothetical protein
LANEQDVVTHREEDGRGDREERAQAPEVRRTDALAGQRDPAGDDQAGADEQQRPQRLAEEDERDRDGDERRGAHQHRGPGRARLPHRPHEKDLREPRGDQPRDQERPDLPEIGVVVCHQGDRAREREGDGGHRKGAELRVVGTAHGEPDGDRHRAEQRGRRARQRDCDHSGSAVDWPAALA